MEIIGAILVYLAIGAVSTGFFKLVENRFIDIDGDTAALIIMTWPIVWVIFIFKVATWPLFWICAIIFD